jgi:hypothetical protein
VRENDGRNLIKVHCKHIWKYHKEVVCVTYNANKNVKREEREREAPSTLVPQSDLNGNRIIVDVLSSIAPGSEGWALSTLR